VQPRDGLILALFTLRLPAAFFHRLCCFFALHVLSRLPQNES
jgi:hypothetical protein